MCWPGRVSACPVRVQTRLGRFPEFVGMLWSAGNSTKNHPKNVGAEINEGGSVSECDADVHPQAYEPFINAGKAVLDAEFEVGDLGLCNDTRWDSIDFIVKVSARAGIVSVGTVTVDCSFVRFML